MPRPSPVAPAHTGGSGGSSIDPLKLLKQYYPMLILAFMIGTGLGIAAFFVLRITYPVYTSKVMFEVRDPLSTVTDSSRVPQSRDEQERYLGTQIQLMTSNLVLTRAVKNPAVLETKWAERFTDPKTQTIEVDKAVRQLEKDVSARILPQTSLLQLSMNSHRDLDCAILANAVSDAFMDDHRSRGRESSSNSRTALTSRITTLIGEIKTLETTRDKMLADRHIDAMEMQSTGASLELSTVSQTLIDVMANQSAVQSRMDEYQNKLRTSSLDQIPDQLREEVKKDPVIQQYEQKIASLKDNEAALLKQGFGNNHDDVKAIRANIDASTRLKEEATNKRLLEMRAADIDRIQSGLASLAAQKKDLEAKAAENSKRREEILQTKVLFEQMNNDVQAKKAELQDYEIAWNNEEIAMFRPKGDKSESVGDRVRVIAVGETPKALSFPQLKMFAPLGAILMTGLVGGLIFLREVLDQRVRGPHEAAMVPRVKVLGIVPQASDDPSRPVLVETAFRDSPTGVITESFRQMRAPLIQKMQQAGHKSLMVISGMPGSGATTVASNLALGCAGAGERVLIIDANFRRPAMQRVYKLADKSGLADVLAGTATLEESIQDSTQPGLSVLCAGSAVARAVPERLASEMMNRVMAEVSAKFDRIFIDVPPAIVAGDGMAVANRCDAAIIVVRAYSEKRGLLARIRNQVGDTRADFLGVVVNAVRSSAGGYFKRNIKATHMYQNGKK
ncbi:MAG: polysaccharide biosynthesis tyrosine autokinase [Pyrinomonadaceae bacterium]|nr:polysaccharide biosynthesis tyrosine autokinase [Phycisphaerales bacterium]